MTEDKKAESEEKMPESMVDTAIKTLRKNHNWKFFAGMIVGYLIMSWVYG